MTTATDTIDAVDKASEGWKAEAERYREALSRMEHEKAELKSNLVLATLKIEELQEELEALRQGIEP
jgi:chromosome segregation ATPase